jgi:hypothetical protein
MTIKSNQSDQDRLIEDIKAKQKNTVWPGPLLNSRGVDEFLWKGSPDAPLVQRLGAWIFGVTFILLGAIFVDIAYERQSWVVIVVSIGLFLLGGRVFLNGFKRHKAKASKRA